MARRGRIAALIRLLTTVSLLIAGCAKPVRLQFRPQIGQKQTMRVTSRLATAHPVRTGRDVTEHAWTFIVIYDPTTGLATGQGEVPGAIRRRRGM